MKNQEELFKKSLRLRELLDKYNKGKKIKRKRGRPKNVYNKITNI